MRLRLPKSNIEWTIDTAGPDSYYTRRDTLVGAFTLPNGERLQNEVHIDQHHARDPQFCEHVIRRFTEDMAREVGLRMLGVK